MMRPRGMPPTPRAMSRASDPVGTNCMSSLTGWSPRRMTLPLPNWRSICVTAASRALSLSKVALLSCSGRGKYCQGSVHGAGPLQEATIQDDADDTKLRDVDVLQGKWLTRTAQTGDGEVRQPGPSPRLEQAGAGLFEPRGRPWLPHLTVARFRRSCQPFPLQNVNIPQFCVVRVVLYSSLLERAGAVHTPLAVFPASGAREERYLGQ